MLDYLEIMNDGSCIVHDKMVLLLICYETSTAQPVQCTTGPIPIAECNSCGAIMPNFSTFILFIELLWQLFANSISMD